MMLEKVYDCDFVNPQNEEDKHFITVWLIEVEGCRAYLLQEDSHLKEFAVDSLRALKDTVNVLATHYEIWEYEPELLKNEL